MSTTPQGLVADAAVIGICGRIGSGKDTVAAMIQQQGNPRELMRWATALRKIAVEVTGVPLSEWWSHADKQQRVELDPERVREAIRGCCLAGPRVAPLVDDHRGFVDEKVAAFADAATAILTAEPELTRGRLLQLLGTECFRSLHDRYWILMMHWEWRGNSKIVIPDTRFENEAEFVKDYGVLIEVRRPGETSSQLMGGREAAHASEPADGALRPQIIIWNDGTLEQLRDAVGLALRTTVADLRPENPLLVLSKPLATPIISSFGLQCRGDHYNRLMSIADVPNWDPSRVAGANVIGICGWPGSGRATVATVVKKYHLPVRRHITWRKALKKLATMVTGIPVYEWWTSEHGRMQLPVQLEEARVRAEIQLCCSHLLPGDESAPFVEATTAALMAERELTRERLLQLLEDCFRRLDAFWVRAMDKDHHRDGYNHDIVISDIATEAGATYVKQHGVLIEIQRPGALGSRLRPHIVVQNDGTLEQLRVAVDIALRLERAGLDPDRPMRITASAISEPTLACYRGTVYPPP